MANVRRRLTSEEIEDINYLGKLNLIMVKNGGGVHFTREYMSVPVVILKSMDLLWHC